MSRAWELDRSLHVGYTLQCQVGSYLPFPVLFERLVVFSTVRFVAAIFLHPVITCIYCGGCSIAVHGGGGGILTRRIVFPHCRCYTTLRLVNEGVWCRRSLSYLHQSALCDDVVGRNRFFVASPCRAWTVCPILRYPHHLNPSHISPCCFARPVSIPSRVGVI